jgi:hypothetical protein
MVPRYVVLQLLECFHILRALSQMSYDYCYDPEQPHAAASHPTHPTQQDRQGPLPPPLHFTSAAHLPSVFDSPPPVPSAQPQHRPSSPSFDIFEWHPRYASCQRYFLDHAQHSGPVQAVASFLNIMLPYQRTPPVYTSMQVPTRGPGSSHALPSPFPPGPAPSTSLIPYLRRLVVTGLDYPGVLHGFFGDDWAAGIGPLHEQERRNYLFAAKSGGWAAVKQGYDMGPLETVPFLRPLQGALAQEIEAAERGWSEWLAMEDWMVGPRAPDRDDDVPGQVPASVEPEASLNAAV